MKKGILILPEGFDPPEQIFMEKYYLEALAPKHNEMDYEAWSSSKDELRGIFGLEKRIWILLNYFTKRLIHTLRLIGEWKELYIREEVLVGMNRSKFT
ncbi:MAG: hypothetical protein DRI73_05435 [Bacteroidetes bacterium]|nr:MAG: hypothetical protein DRI73_05435 [Bacteroidota bacterium]